MATTATQESPQSPEPPAAPEPPDTTPLRLGRRDWLFLLALWAAVFLVYRPAWQGTPLWDDDQNITRPELCSLQGLGRIWTEAGATQQYYPLVHSVFWLEHRLWGDATTGYHLVNIGLHALAATLAWLILRRLRVPGAALAAAAFALHPLQVESVAWITELKNTLSAVFGLGAVLAYLRFDAERTRRWYDWALALFILGVLSKTVVAVLPAVMLVLFWWRRGRLSWKRDCLPLAPLVVLGVLAGALTAVVERRLVGAVGEEFDFTPVERGLMAGRVVFFYLGKLLWPADLVFMYPRWQVRQGQWWAYGYPAAALLLLALLWVLCRRWRGPLATGLLYLAVLFPALGFFNVFLFRYSLVADHFQYLACLPVCAAAAALAAGVCAPLAPRARAAGYALGVLLLGTLAVLTWRQSRMYSDLDTLYRVTLARNPGCWMIYNNLGCTAALKGKTPQAIELYKKALAYDPDFPEAHFNLGDALRQTGDLPGAVTEYRLALRARAGYARAHNNLADTLRDLGRWPEAIEHYRQTVQLWPDNAPAYFNLGLALVTVGKTQEAADYYQQGLKLQPNPARFPECVSLAWLLATREPGGDGQGALRLAQCLYGLTGPTDVHVLDALAAAYASAGRFPDAVATAQEALHLAQDLGPAALVEPIAARLALYRDGQPYREPAPPPATQPPPAPAP